MQLNPWGWGYMTETWGLVIERCTGTELLDQRLLSSAAHRNFKTIRECEHAARAAAPQCSHMLARDPPRPMHKLPFIALFGNIFQRSENQGVASSGVNPYVLQLRACRDQVGPERRW